MSATVEEIVKKIGQLSNDERKSLIEVVETQRKADEQAERRVFIKSLKGKYKDGLSSVESFIAHKQEEIDREDRGWGPLK